MAEHGLDPARLGAETLERVGKLIRDLGGELGGLASQLLTTHGYDVGPDGGGPHMNVLGHPLFEIPIWVANAVAAPIEAAVLSDIAESSLCGYLSVRAEDDYFDQRDIEAEPAMMLSSYFRARHQALLARHLTDERFWDRFLSLWRDYGEAMLLERRLHDPLQEYGRAEFDLVLRRSQPLEIPGGAVLAISDRWDLAEMLSGLVGHLTRATQLLDDLADAPEDLRNGNYTWMVRRLGGLNGEQTLKRSMIISSDEILAEAGEELDRALRTAGEIGIAEFPAWAESRRAAMVQASEKMYNAFFSHVGKS